MQETRLYRLVGHVCRHCGGRVAVSKPDSAGRVRVCCTVCEAAVDDVDARERGIHERLCMCGVRLPGDKAVFKCMSNPDQGLALPQAFVAVPVGQP